MALRQILTDPNKILREKSLFVEKVDDDLQKLFYHGGEGGLI